MKLSLWRVLVGLLVAPALWAVEATREQFRHEENVDLSTRQNGVKGPDGRYFQEYTIPLQTGSTVRALVTAQAGDKGNPAAMLLDSVRLFADYGDGRWRPVDGLQLVLETDQEERLRFMLTTQNAGQTAQVYLRFDVLAPAEPPALTRHEVYGGTLPPGEFVFYTLHQHTPEERFRFALQSEEFVPILRAGTLKPDGLSTLPVDYVNGGDNTSEIDFTLGKEGDFVVAVGALLSHVGGSYRLRLDMPVRWRKIE